MCIYILIMFAMWVILAIKSHIGAIKPGWIDNFLHKEMPVHSQEYDSCFPYIWCVWALDFAIFKGTFRFEFYLKIVLFFVILLSSVPLQYSLLPYFLFLVVSLSDFYFYTLFNYFNTHTIEKPTYISYKLFHQQD